VVCYLLWQREARRQARTAPRSSETG
jgi:hypothetical protein